MSIFMSSGLWRGNPSNKVIKKRTILFHSTYIDFFKVNNQISTYIHIAMKISFYFILFHHLTILEDLFWSDGIQSSCFSSIVSPSISASVWFRSCAKFCYSEVAKYIYIFCFNLPPTSPHLTSHCPSRSVPRLLFDESPQAQFLLSCLLKRHSNLNVM